MATFPDDGKLILVAHLGEDIPYCVHLFKNNRVPATDDVAGDYTEADFDGYFFSLLPVSLSLSDYGINSAGNATLNFDKLPFIYEYDGDGIANTIYGYYLIADGCSGEVFIGAELFPDPIIMACNGDRLDVEVQFVVGSRVCLQC